MPKTPQHQDEKFQAVQAQIAPTTAAVDAASQTPAQQPTNDPEAQKSSTDVLLVSVPGLELMAEAERENIKHSFYQKVAEARANRTAPEPTPPKVPERIARQTSEEMEAGARLVAQRAAEQELRVPHKETDDKWAGKTTSVFRPADYVPDPKKNTGHVAARSQNV